MRILIDFRSWQLEKGRGIGRYIKNLTKAIIEKYHDLEVSVLLSKSLQNCDIEDDLKDKVSVYFLETFKNDTIDKFFDFFILGEYFSLRRNDKKDIYPCDVIKKSNDVVGILYDFIPMIFPKNYLSDSTAALNYAKIFELIKYASHIFSISDCTKYDGMKYLEKPEEYFTTIYGGANNEIFKPNPDGYDIQKRTNNIVCLLGDDRRKNYQGTVEVFSKAYSEDKLPKDAKLYIICKASQYMKDSIENIVRPTKAKYGEQVIVTDFIPDNELLNLLQNARASVFPSFYEGLGLPILESYSAGTPCFASSLSSTKEFVDKECSFNPYNKEEFENMIVRIYQDDDLCIKSIESGKEMLKKFNWENSAELLINKLFELKEKNKQEKNKRKEKIAVFSTMPPDETGIAIYSQKLHFSEPENYDIFCNIEKMEDFEDLNSPHKNVFPVDIFPYAEMNNNYKGKIFVIGNSSHHKTSIEWAIRTRGESNRWLYFHESDICFSYIPFFCNFTGYKNFLKMCYPKFKDAIEKQNSKYEIFVMLKERGVYGVLPILRLSGIRNIFVNNESAKSMILKEAQSFGLNDLRIEVLYLPVENLLDVEPINFDKEYIVGSFGLPTPDKMSEEILKAVELLNSSGNKITLLFAGYNVNHFIGDRKYDFILKYDAPSQDELFKLMKSVDLAVQLRPNPHGESSGCISQLLGMGQNILTSEGFVSDNIREFCHTVKKHPTTEELADTILNALHNKKTYNAAKICEEMSFKNLSSKIIQILS